MANVTKIAANGIDYDIEDATARSNITSLQSDVSTLQSKKESGYIASHATGNLALAAQEMGFIVFTNSDTAAQEIIIFYTTNSGTVYYSQVRSASKISFSKSANTLSVTNNSESNLWYIKYKK